MREIQTEIDIAAPAGRVWSILIDFDAYERWNPLVVRARGEARPGARLEVTIQPEGKSASSFKPTILRADEAAELRWRGKLLIPGLFDGEHYFRLEPTGPESCRFIHGEQFSGILVAPLLKNLEAGVRAGFEAMNRELKRRAEGSGASVARDSET